MAPKAERKNQQSPRCGNCVHWIGLNFLSTKIGHCGVIERNHEDATNCPDYQSDAIAEA